MKKYEKFLLIGFILIIIGFILPQITLSTDHALIGFLMIYLGLSFISSVLVYMSYLNFNEAKEGKDVGLMEGLFGIFLTIFSITSLFFSVWYYSQYSGELEIIHLCIGIDLILVMLLIIGSFKVLSFILQGNFNKGQSRIK